MIIEAFPLKIYRTNINIDNKIILEEAKRTMNRDVPFHLNDAHNGYTSVQKRFWEGLDETIKWWRINEP